jgi:DNA mismatch repair protein MutS2
MRRRKAAAAVAPAAATEVAASPAAAAGPPSRGLDAFASLYLLFGALLHSSGALGTVTGKAAALGLFASLARALLRFRRWNDETPHALRFFRAFAGLVAWLLVENCCIWCARRESAAPANADPCAASSVARAVSASDLRKYERTPPLQDNLELAYGLLLRRLPPAAADALEWSLAHEWIGIKEKLVALIALGFAAVFDAVPYSGFGMCNRFVACVAYARAIRTVAFLLTILPNPRPGCYSRRFPPVPDTWADFLRVGFGRMRSGGGCNDLVLSGHAVIYAAVCCAYSEFYPGVASKILWFALVRSSVRGPLTQQHYSVDMFLASVVTALTWRACEGVYPRQAKLAPREPGTPPDPKGRLQWALTAAVFVVLAVLALIIIVGGA